jgi:hypothetical protein
MTHISFTSGELLDIISALESKENDDPHLASYYLYMIQQFKMVYDKLQDLIPEDRVAHFVLASN